MTSVGLQTDFNSGDLLVEHSAAVVADASGFIAELVVVAPPGDFKELPLLGADAPSMLAGNRDPFWPGETKKMLRAVGLDVDNVAVDVSGTINIS